jgi:hypothetical protein
MSLRKFVAVLESLTGGTVTVPKPSCVVQKLLSPEPTNQG